jgi:putative cell wall-binding protein
VLLASRDRAPDATLLALTALESSETVVTGGPNSVSEAVFGQLGATQRIQGRDRYEVAANVAAYGLSRGFLSRRAVVATGLDYPDSLTSSVLAARVRGPVLLVKPTMLPEAPRAHLQAHAGERLDVWVCGGENSVAASVLDAIEDAVGAL